MAVILTDGRTKITARCSGNSLSLNKLLGKKDRREQADIQTHAHVHNNVVLLVTGAAATSVAADAEAGADLAICLCSFRQREPKTAAETTYSLFNRKLPDDS